LVLEGQRVVQHERVLGVLGRQEMPGHRELCPPTAFHLNNKNINKYLNIKISNFALATWSNGHRIRPKGKRSGSNPARYSVRK
jgi:hypothetical protein